MGSSYLALRTAINYDIGCNFSFRQRVEIATARGRRIPRRYLRSMVYDSRRTDRWENRSRLGVCIVCGDNDTLTFTIPRRWTDTNFLVYTIGRSSPLSNDRPNNIERGARTLHREPFLIDAKKRSFFDPTSFRFLLSSISPNRLQFSYDSEADAPRTFRSQDARYRRPTLLRVRWCIVTHRFN